MHPSKPGNHAYEPFQARTQELKKNEKIEIGRNASNDTGSIPIAPRDLQKHELMHFFGIFHFFTKLINFNAD